MYSLAVLSLIGTLLSASASAAENQVVMSPASSPKVLSMPIRKGTKAEREALEFAIQEYAAQNHVISDISNLRSQYVMDCSVGSPWQQVTLWIDTGSSDTWVFNPTACSNVNCVKGQFDPSQSTSYQDLNKPFHVGYFGASVDGGYFTDTFGLGGIGIQALQMGLATTATNLHQGLVGLNGNQGQSYRILPQVLADQGWTNTAAFSIWMDDMYTQTGEIMFGAYDTNKFTGDLVVMDWDLGVTGMSITDGSGVTSYPSASYPFAAIIDTGAQYTNIPPDIWGPVAAYFNVTCDYRVPCSFGYETGSLDFTLGPNQDVTIHMPFSELVDTGSRDSNGMCHIMVGLGAPGGQFLGEPFLRQAFIVWDSDRKQVGMAQSKFNVADGDANIVEITADGNLAGAPTPTSITFASPPSATAGWCGQ